MKKTILHSTLYSILTAQLLGFIYLINLNYVNKPYFILVDFITTIIIVFFLRFYTEKERKDQINNKRIEYSSYNNNLISKNEILFGNIANKIDEQKQIFTKNKDLLEILNNKLDINHQSFNESKEELFKKFDTFSNNILNEFISIKSAGKDLTETIRHISIQNEENYKSFISEMKTFNESIVEANKLFNENAYNFKELSKKNKEILDEFINNLTSFLNNNIMKMGELNKKVSDAIKNNLDDFKDGLKDFKRSIEDQNDDFIDIFSEKIDEFNKAVSQQLQINFKETINVYNKQLQYLETLNNSIVQLNESDENLLKKLIEL